MRDAVIVSTARTGIGKAYRGAFNATPSPTLAAHPIRAAIERAGVDPGEVDDVIMGAALQQGVQTHHRPAPPRCAPGCRSTVAGHVDRPPVRVGPDGDRDRRQAGHRRPHGRRRRRRRRKHQPGPDRRDAPRPRPRAAGHAQRRLHADDRHRRRSSASATASAASAATNMRCARSSAPPRRSAAGRFDDEIIPVTAKMAVKDKETGEVSMHEVTLDQGRGQPRRKRRSKASPSSSRCAGRKNHHRRQRQPASATAPRPAW